MSAEEMLTGLLCKGPRLGETAEGLTVQVLERHARELAAEGGDRLIINGKVYEVEEYEFLDSVEGSDGWTVWVKRDDPGGAQ